jgi:hypothetical protein
MLFIAIKGINTCLLLCTDVNSVHVSIFTTLSLSHSLSLSSQIASVMADIILNKTEKTSLNLSEHQNVITYTPTADSLPVAVHVARIVKGKTYIFTSV